ncbi:molybdopterin-guanine dinucleotide biosynthesis protein B [Acetobacter senegalensis]|uniref:molybdopterin-guanine dinucleotide biosynthesis protein B n=1 Tax=Acetobacter senegalensis TaxID=446692 RepID=UPI00128E8542|nr:molybdopterin-guanine dinucleotide biosynthesis protein B [Acetobacter senegalensis]MCG4258434.1 molybdopterin-guanine dinucleotide biosynthesis protein B [Acetobacter senegalensis]MCG4268360.1 molybdopterin-guanine dinucleotide biosynthesis protein B [Acetobacter senegalensis]MPQ73979.1 molybdopterin-guanine dinucleotide biosynthesis protein B [Acetobacter senegalensis]
MSIPRQQAVIGLTGRSGSGKTHLMARLLPALRARGLSVSTIKHTHHHIDIDKPGKDSFIHRQAGACEVMLVTPDRWVLQHTQPEPSLRDVLGRMAPVDLVIIEGFHASIPAALEVYRPEVGKEPLFKKQTNILAVATTTPSAVPSSLLTLDLDNTDAIAEFILKNSCSVQLI